MGYTFSPFLEEVMLWKDCSVIDERFQFVARSAAPAYPVDSTWN
jgi:hypothetical protein